MTTLEKVKMLALEIVNSIDNDDLDNAKTYAKLGIKIEKLNNLRLEVIRMPYVKREEQ